MLSARASTLPPALKGSVAFFGSNKKAKVSRSFFSKKWAGWKVKSEIHPPWCSTQSRPSCCGKTGVYYVGYLLGNQYSKICIDYTAIDVVFDSWGVRLVFLSFVVFCKYWCLLYLGIQITIWSKCGQRARFLLVLLIAKLKMVRWRLRTQFPHFWQ